MSRFTLPIFALMIAVLTGCQTGSLLTGRNADSPVSAAALVDGTAEGTVGEGRTPTDELLVKTPLSEAVGNTFASGDFSRADRAQKTVLDKKRGGVPIAWFNPDTGKRGEVVAGPIYTINGRQCRDYIHKVTIRRAKQDVRGIACFEENSGWVNIS